MGHLGSDIRLIRGKLSHFLSSYRFDRSDRVLKLKVLS